ncbi:MAG: hypothetical protein JO115_15360 [Pseudonocardiales bacterium]|nr:hypothetical protein [Pseudonocardiales bacterium]
MEGASNFNVSFASKGRRMAISRYNTAAIFDVAKRTLIATYPKPDNGSTALSSDEHTIALVDADRSNVISLIDTDLYDGTSVRARHVAIQPDNKHRTTVSFDGEMAIHSIENRNLEPISARSPADDQPNEREIDSLSPNKRSGRQSRGPVYCCD